MKAGVIVFPGSNCDHDAWYAVNENLHGRAEFIWHDSTNLGDIDAVHSPRRLLLRRLSALRRHRPLLARDAGREEIRRRWRPGARDLQRFSDSGGSRSAARRFAAQSRAEIHLPRSGAAAPKPPTRPSLRNCAKGQILRLPIAHGEGRYFADDRTLDELESDDRVAFRYIDNPNGSARVHRRHSEPRAQRDGNDAASGARLRSADGLHRWPGHIRIDSSAQPPLSPNENHTRADRAAPAHHRGVRQNRELCSAASRATPSWAFSA